MNPIPADYEKLARTLCEAREENPEARFSTIDGDMPFWESLGIDEDSDLVIETSETLDGFQASMRSWNEPGTMQEVAGGLYWPECQAMKGERRCELCVVDCGEFRLAYQC